VPAPSAVTTGHVDAWRPVGTAAAFATVVLVLWLLLRASTGDRFVPIVDHANLAFHEAGHLIVGVFSSRLAVYGGSLGQLVFPLLATWQFHRRRHAVGYVLCLGWGAESLLNVATYVGDARSLALPLIGGLDPATHHDWREILGRWDLLEADTALATALRVVAWFTGVAGCFWLMRRWLEGRAGETTG
jgi:hypothetical protein